MNLMSLANALPGAVAQGLIWGIMAIGVYITFPYSGFRRPDGGRFALHGRRGLYYDHDERTKCLGGDAGGDAGRHAGGSGDRPFTYVYGYPAILSGILTQLGLYSINLKIMGKRIRR